MVLLIFDKINEFLGNIEVYGVIGDCYFEIGEMELVVKYYDMYIDRL